MYLKMGRNERSEEKIWKEGKKKDKKR